jgi:hypothetical protein
MAHSPRHKPGPGPPPNSCRDRQPARSCTEAQAYIADGLFLHENSMLWRVGREQSADIAITIAVVHVEVGWIADLEWASDIL